MFYNDDDYDEDDDSRGIVTAEGRWFANRVESLEREVKRLSFIELNANKKIGVLVAQVSSLESDVESEKEKSRHVSDELKLEQQRNKEVLCDNYRLVQMIEESKGVHFGGALTLPLVDHSACCWADNTQK